MAAATSSSTSTLNEIHLDSPDYVVEFYSGIGGMHYGLQLAHSACRVSVSMDINTLANAVYTHNFPDMRVYSRSIEGLKPDDIVRRLIKAIPVDEHEAEQSGKLPNVFKSANAG